MRADGGAMLRHHLRRRDQMQRLSRMADLARPVSACVFSRRLRVSWRTAFQPVRGRRFAAIVTIFCQPRFQLLHTRHQHRDLVALFGVLGFKLGDSGFQIHA